MRPRLALLIALAALAGGAQAVDVYKWTDDHGVVHYGDHPASGVAATEVALPDDTPKASDAASARQRLARDRAQLQAGADSDAAPRRPAAAAPAISACEAAWRQYDTAQACFAGHRVAGGRGVTPTGQAVCPQLPQPTCTRGNP